VTQLSAEFLALQGALAGEYSLQRELGRGGMGVVYLARDVQLDRDVAIKVLPAHLASEPQHRARFLREARMAAGLSHPHIVPIHRVSVMGGYVFFVMSFIEGETLGERLRRSGPMPAHEVTRMLREVSWALAYAHGRGIVHRDVKPDNILLEAATGRALVTDFGIAFGGADPLVATDRGKIMGTAHYISPEQAAGGDVDGRSDIYALGVVGYLAVTGRLPFDSVTPSEARGLNLPALLLRQATEQPQSVMRASPGLPPALGAAIDKCLSRDPEQRFTDGEALAEALAPQLDARPALPPTLRAWLAASNPLIVPFLGWSAGFSALTLGNLYANLTNNPGSSPADVALLAALAAAPLLPIVGFHVNQARLQFRAGHSLEDLRSALAIEGKERAETEAAAPKDQEQSGPLRLLRNATIASATWLGVTVGLLAGGIIHENVAGIWWLLAPLGSTMALGALSNAFDIQFIPDGVRRSWRIGIRDRIWNSQLGDWFAKRLGAPEKSKLAGPSAFRATEAALGVAAGELFAALPQAYKAQLSELPNVVALLEARASEARAEMEVVSAMAPAAVDAEILAERKRKASKQLAESVAALEGIRLDLLKVHAGAGDLAPLTTLLDAAKVIGEDLDRLAQAQSETDRIS
jgi:serine/threonine protein kinase